MSQARIRRTLRALAFGSLAALSLGCGSDDGPATSDCADAFKCDIPSGKSEDLCVLRRNDAFNENQLAYQEQGLRWSCADVAGVTNEDRGQEYCEYFAMVDLPGTAAGEPEMLGRNLGADFTYGTTEQRLELTYDQLTALEVDESAVVGQCIFTSWNSDIPGPVAACAGGAPACPEVLGVPVSQDIFGMKFAVNSAEAGQLIVEDCLALPPGGVVADKLDPLHDDFFRGCMFNAAVNQTAYRKSDSTICASAIRLAECGCAPTDDAYDLPEEISPFYRLGFPLGTWSDENALPAGCTYIDEGEGSNTLVTCDLSASDVIMGASDLKGLCKNKYGDNVVVHVPYPKKEAITCTPDPTSNQYAETCSATPWLLEPQYLD